MLGEEMTIDGLTGHKNLLINDFIYFKYPQISLVDVERSFSLISQKYAVR